MCFVPIVFLIRRPHCLVEARLSDCIQEIPIEPSLDTTVDVVSNERRETPDKPVQHSTKEYKTRGSPQPITDGEGVQSCVVSIAYRKADSQCRSTSPISPPSVNKLNDEPNASITPTQAEILSRIIGQETTGKAGIENSDTDKRSQLHLNHVDVIHSAELSNVQAAPLILGHEDAHAPHALTSPGPNSRDAFAGEIYDRMGYYEQMQRQFQEIAQIRLKEHDSVHDTESQSKTDLHSSCLNSTVADASSYTPGDLLDATRKPQIEISQCDAQYQKSPVIPDRSLTLDLPIEHDSLQDSAKLDTTSTANSNYPQLPNADHSDTNSKQGDPDQSRHNSSITPVNRLESVDEIEHSEIRSEGCIDLTPVLNVLDSRADKLNNQENRFGEIKEPGSEAQTSRSLGKGVTGCSAMLDTSINSASGTSITAKPDGSERKFEENERPNKNEAEERGSDCNCRTVVLTNLPYECDFTMVQSLVSGGVIESMKLDRDQRKAHVTFTKTHDCQKYLEACQNGIRFKHSRDAQIVKVTPSIDPETTDVVTQAYIRCGATRVVQADGADTDLTMAGLYKLAEGLPRCREVECILVSSRQGYNTIVFRFTNVNDAVSFREQENQSQTLKNACLQFIEDPCSHAAINR